MKKLREDWTVRTFMTNLEEGLVSFEYPIQRKGKQWGEVQRSLLIHSVIEDYPIPSLFSIVEKEERLNSKNKPYEVEVYQILDGKQRLTNIADYIKGDYSLHSETPSIELNGEDVEIAGKFFSELHPKTQEKIMACELQMYRLQDATEEQIEDIFFRLQNGTPLTKQQQGKAKMGAEWAQRLTQLCSEHPVFKFNAQFTPLQIRKADDEMTIIQTMMMIDELHTLKSISSNDSFDYAIQFKENSEHRLQVFNRVVEALDYVHEAFGQQAEKFLLKKVHMPMVLITALHAKDAGVAPVRFKDWTSEFEASYKCVGKKYIPTRYKNFAGAGSVKAVKAIGRKDEMIKHFDTYINIPVEEKENEISSAVSAVKSELENKKSSTEEKSQANETTENSNDNQETTAEQTETNETEVVIVTETEDKKEEEQEVTIEIEDKKEEEVTVDVEEKKLTPAQKRKLAKEKRDKAGLLD